MNIHDGADLHKKVERYEAAVDELRAAQQDVKDVLTEPVLYRRWEQVGAEVGFSASQLPAEQPSSQPHRELASVSQGHDMNEGW